MADWLADLREAKKRALESSAGETLDQATQAESEEMLRSAQQRFDDFLQTTQVEPQLIQFMDEIIRGHPWFPDSALTRTVISKQLGQPEQKEPQPWSGPLSNNPLPHPLALPNGRYVTRIDWNLRLSYRGPQEKLAKTISIPIAFSALGAGVNALTLSAPNPESMQAAIKGAFQSAVDAAQKPHHTGRRRHRRWYVRLWNQLSYKGSSAIRVALVLVLIALALLIGWLSLNSNRILPSGPRRMVEIQRAIPMGYGSSRVNG